MKVKAIITYDDKELNKRITPADEPFEVTEERAKELLGNNKNYIVCVEEVKDKAKAKTNAKRK